MAIKKFSPLLAENPLCGIGQYKDVLDLSTGGVTRQIKKVLLTGEEIIYSVTQNVAENAHCFVYKYPNLGMSDIINYNEYVNTISYPEYISSHFNMRVIPTTQVMYNALSPGEMGANSWATTQIGWWNQYLIFCTDLCSTEAEFKQYLTSQYAAGTPVTVWYILATPETETITVPSGLTGTIEGYLTQSGTPTPSAPIYPEANPALAWVPTTYRKFGNETDTLTSFPAQIIGDGQPITSCQISGNLVQNGIPTPSVPIYPQECGDLETTGEHAGQYKLPISCGGAATSVYLGETQSTRKIKKLVFDGTEDWEIITNNNPYFRLSGKTSDGEYAIVVCSHFVSPSTSISANNTTVGVRVQSTTSYGYVIILRTPTWQTDTLSDFKSFLADEYANGAPVTVWYVLKEPETTTLNEPIRKIGNYADTVSVANIPTTGASENFDILTTLKPSEVQLTYHGWHEL